MKTFVLREERVSGKKLSFVGFASEIFDCKLFIECPTMGIADEVRKKIQSEFDLADEVRSVMTDHGAIVLLDDFELIIVASDDTIIICEPDRIEYSLVQVNL